MTNSKLLFLALVLGLLGYAAGRLGGHENEALVPEVSAQGGVGEPRGTRELVDAAVPPESRVVQVPGSQPGVADAEGELPASLEVSPESPDPLDGLVDLYLGDGVLERKLLISKRLTEVTREPFKELWRRGEYQIIQQPVGPSQIQDEEGRPKPVEIRTFRGGETRMVMLDEAEHPEAWILIQALKDVQDEIKQLEIEANKPAPSGD